MYTFEVFFTSSVGLHCIGRNTQNMNQKPEVGMGATYGIGSDCYPVTIIEVSPSGHQIKLQHDKFELTDRGAVSGTQVYDYAPNPDADVKVFTRRQDGEYREKGKNFGYLIVGKRKAHIDYDR